MKDIVKATDLFTIYSGLLSTETGGRICFWYLVARFILKNAAK